jgi:ubiquitin-protein ligase
VKSGLLDKNIENFVFDVLLDHKFPFQQPQIMCRTNFSSPPINDGRDLFNDILKSEWKIAKKLYEIV